MRCRKGRLTVFIESYTTSDDVRGFPRLAAFYIIGVFIGGFSAIFAYVLTLLHGRYGIAGWAWVFVSL